MRVDRWSSSASIPLCVGSGAHHRNEMNHDVIAIGASAGGVELLLDLASKLPADLPASIFVALHSSPAHKSPLPELLSRRGPLPASHPVHQERIKRGHIY